MLRQTHQWAQRCVHKYPLLTQLGMTMKTVSAENEEQHTALCTMRRSAPGNRAPSHLSQQNDLSEGLRPASVIQKTKTSRGGLPKQPPGHL